MDKNAIKKYAVWARRELIERVTQRAMMYGITAKDNGDPNADSVNGHLLTRAEKLQRQALIRKIREQGFEQVMEEVAYTWFNRFAALRFMEVNGYLPSHVRVFTNDAGEFKPQILAEAIHLELEGLDRSKVYELESANKSEELFKYLLIVQCNALNSILPGMFQKIEDYTELLLPDYLLREGSVIEQMVTAIPEEDWTDQVQIIGWLYQYYIAEPKDELINARKQYKDEDIPFVTQLFTSDWIVRFMVENSLGRLWLERHPNPELRTEWKYYLEKTEARNVAISDDSAELKPEDILAIDPCQGSGHVLAYMFDLFVQIYQTYGYSAREAAASIVKHNLWGLDIDERATQLSYFSVMMKARQYDRRFLNRGIQPHIYAIRESNHIDPFCINYFVDGKSSLKTDIETLIAELHDAKEYGSSISVSQVDFASLFARFEEIREEKEPNIYTAQALEELLPLVQVAQAMSQKYHVVVTNPPYLSASYMPNKLKTFVQENYPDFKNDMFAVFLNKAVSMCVQGGHVGLLMPYVWMFIVTYENMRMWLNRNADITALVQLEYNAFEAACVPVASLTIRKGATGQLGEYIRLSDFKGIENQNPKTLYAVSHPDCNYRFSATQRDFMKIPGVPVAYWISNQFLSVFDNQTISNIASVQEGLKTADNDRFIRYWYEVDYTKTNIDGNNIKKWIKHTKGGQFRRWYGNNDFVLNYDNDGSELKNYKKASLTGINNYFKQNITWTRISTGQASFRYTPAGSIPNMAGLSLYCDDVFYYLALLNSKVISTCLSIMNPTINYPPGTIGKIPILYDEVIAERIRNLSRECVLIAKEDYDSFELSWDFKGHPLASGTKISKTFEKWSTECLYRFKKLTELETEINQLFSVSYGVANEISADVNEELVSVNKAVLNRDIRSLLSYAVGCMFGRYSLDISGLTYAGGIWDASKYVTYRPDFDAIIPICDDEYFEDDVVGRFVQFIEVVYGKETLEENLRFIADALGGKGTSREVIRNYFINDFYADHLKVYQKRPIYWLFDSGKKNGFKCLIYMHRYQPDTIARIRTDYVHEQQSRYRTVIADLEQRIKSASTSERVKLSKQLAKVQDQAEELRVYEEKIHHLADQMIPIDLDDGVKVNYAKFQDVLAKIK